MNNKVGVIKNIYHNSVILFWRNKRKLRSLLLKLFPRQLIFSHYYKTNKWGSSESRSGDGSLVNETLKIRESILDIFDQYDIKFILDAPCGDFNWMKLVDLSSVEYVGADIVDDLIALNNKNYSNNNIIFIKLDVCKEDLPVSDLMLCRDALVHFSNKDIEIFVRNLKNSQIKYILTTTFPHEESNIDISTGMWRPLNLCKSPFNFPEPILVINENYAGKNGRYKDKSLALWEVSKI